MKYIFLGLSLIVSAGCANSTFYYQDGKKQTLTPVKSQTRSNPDVDYYKTSNNVKVGVTDTLLVKFIDTKNLSAYAKEYDFVVVKEVVKDLYLLKVKDKSLTIQTANKLYKKSDIKFAHPNFIKKRIPRWEYL